MLGGGGFGGSINNRSTPRRELDYSYGSFSRSNTRNRSSSSIMGGSRQVIRDPIMSNWDIGADDENMSIHSYESVRKQQPLSFGSRNDFDRPRAERDQTRDSRWLVEQGRISPIGYSEERPPNYRNIGPSYAHARSSGQFDGKVLDGIGTSEMDRVELLGRIEEFHHHVRNSSDHRYEIEMPRDWNRPPNTNQNRSVKYRHRSSNSRVSEEYDDFNQDPFPLYQHQMGSKKIPEAPVDSGFDSRERWLSSENNDGLGTRIIGSATAMNTKNRKYYCCPFAGAAPLVMCSNCSILVLLPQRRRRLRIEENRHEVRCGSCSAVMLVEVDGKRIMISTTMVKDALEVIEESSCEAAAIEVEESSNEAIKRKCKSLISSAVGFSSHGYTGDDGVSYAHSDEHVLSDAVYVGNCRPELNLDLDSSSSSMKKVGDEEKEEVPRSEIEVPHVEYPITGFSQDSVDVSKEEDHGPRPERSKPFFGGIDEGGIKEQPRSIGNEISSEDTVPNESFEEDLPVPPKVTVNGHPIPDFAVKKAEFMAGPILPGQYWYDYNAGFWGVMNYPCLGIIPPFIEELNYMMPERCAAGNTGVFVNGRELHQRDLDLLGSRGLPTTKYKSYSVHISGKVFDERTGEELFEYDLGKLAPSVENAKRGFGMRVPSGVL